ALPESLLYSAADGAKWKIDAFDMPDLSNPAAILAPPAEQAQENGDAADETPLGLVVLLADPGEADLNQALAAWAEPAQSAGVIICMVGPADEQRWTPEEVDVPQRLAAAIRQSYN